MDCYLHDSEIMEAQEPEDLAGFKPAPEGQSMFAFLTKFKLQAKPKDHPGYLTLPEKGPSGAVQRETVLPRKPPNASAMIPALQFWAIPVDLWPYSARMALKAGKLKDGCTNGHDSRLRALLKQCIEVRFAKYHMCSLHYLHSQSQLPWCLSMEQSEHQLTVCMHSVEHSVHSTGGAHETCCKAAKRVVQHLLLRLQIAPVAVQAPLQG